MAENTKDSIDLRKALKLLKKRKWLFAKVLIPTLILSAAYIVCIPRTYTSNLTLAPESSDMSAGGIASMASSLGFDLGDNSSNDAIYPMLYPDAFASTEFIVSLFSIKVTTDKGDVSADYYTYLTKHQKHTPWAPAINKLKSTIAEITDSDEAGKANKKGAEDTHDPFRLDKKETEIVKQIQQQIKCEVDKKTSVITITVIDQDPLISAVLCDSVRVRLQDYITHYRTQKARTDYMHYTAMAQEAHEKYEKAAQEYATYSDSHQNNVLAVASVKESALENEMQSAYSAYTQFSQQARMYEAKVQENTPAFVVLQNATVPIKPSQPKRMIFVLAMVIFATILTTIYIEKDVIFPKPIEEEEEESDDASTEEGDNKE